MSDVQSIIGLRNTLAHFVRDTSHRTTLTSREIAAQFRIQHPLLIQHCADDLHEIALIQLINQLAKRRSTIESASNQAQLFQDFKIDPNVTVTIGDGGTKKIRKNTLDLTLSEAEFWVHSHTKAPPRLSKPVREMSRLLEIIKPFMVPGMSISQGWEAWRNSRSS